MPAITAYDDGASLISRSGFTVAIVIAAAIVIWAANLFGAWWVTALLGLGIGLLPWKARRALGIATLAGVLGWTLGLAWLVPQENVGDAATVVAEIMGLGSGLTVILLALLLAALLAFTGAWLGIALRRLLEPHSHDPFGQF
jgi:hypothetical protein